MGTGRARRSSLVVIIVALLTLSVQSFFTGAEARTNSRKTSTTTTSSTSSSTTSSSTTSSSTTSSSTTSSTTSSTVAPTTTSSTTSTTIATSTASGDASTSTAEPRLATDSNVLWEWTMDNPSGARATIGTGFDENYTQVLSTTPTPAPSGSGGNGNVLKIRQPVNESGVPHDQYTGYGIAQRRRFSQLNLTPQRSLHMRYSLYIPSNFNPYDGGKLYSLFSHPSNRSLWGAQGMSSAGVYSDDSWWAGIMFVGPSAMSGTYPNRYYTGDTNLDHIRIQPYVYAKQINGVTMTTTSVTNGQRGWNVKLRSGLTQDPNASPTSTGTGTGSYLYLNRGKWNTIEQEVVLNSAGSANGILRMWVNGTLGLNVKNVKWAGDTYNSTATINGLMLDTFFGGPSANVTDQTLYYDDVVLSKGYVGPRS